MDVLFEGLEAFCITKKSQIGIRIHQKLASGSTTMVKSSVPDPDSYVFKQSGFINQRYGSGSFHHQTKNYEKSKKNLYFYCDFFLTFYLWRMYIQKVISKKIIKKYNYFLLESWRSLTKRAGYGSGSASQRYGSTDPDPYKNITDPEQHWLKVSRTDIWVFSTGGPT